MPWYHDVAERYHEIQNPTSPEKIRLLGERMRLGPDSAVLDIASGRGGPARVLAAQFGCHITCVERFDGFIEVARERSAAAGLDHLIDIVAADASKFEVDPERYDAALCIGASFVYGGLVPTLTVLRPGVRRGGHVAVGEVFWHAPPPADLEDYGAGSFSERFGLFETAGLPVVSVIAASDDDWDRYDTLHYVAIEDWLAEHGSEDGAAEIRAAHAAAKSYYARTRGLIGWAIFVGRRIGE